MSPARNAVKVPMKKLFAVATIVGAASGTAIAVSPHATPVHAEAAPVASSPVVVVASSSIAVATPPVVVATPPVEAVAPLAPDIAVDRVVITPLTLGSGWPACGNVVNKAGYAMPRTRCPTTAEQTVGIVVQSMLGHR